MFERKQVLVEAWSEFYVFLALEHQWLELYFSNRNVYGIEGSLDIAYDW